MSNKEWYEESSQEFANGFTEESQVHYSQIPGEDMRNMMYRYDLEIVAISERLNQTLECLQQDFSTLRFTTKSRLFVVFQGVLPAPLTDHQRALLDSYKEQAIIRAYRCKKQKE